MSTCVLIEFRGTHLVLLPTPFPAKHFLVNRTQKSKVCVYYIISQKQNPNSHLFLFASFLPTVWEFTSLLLQNLLSFVWLGFFFQRACPFKNTLIMYVAIRVLNGACVGLLGVSEAAPLLGLLGHAASILRSLVVTGLLRMLIT